VNRLQIKTRSGTRCKRAPTGDLLRLGNDKQKIHRLCRFQGQQGFGIAVPYPTLDDPVPVLHPTGYSVKQKALISQGFFHFYKVHITSYKAQADACASEGLFLRIVNG
jgi:hypothetical protein